MGFYLRKSVRVGPVRFNLSKSGVGVSAGVRGFRVGSGPRGNYVHMGRQGIYYRSTLPSGTRPARGGPPAAEGHAVQDPRLSDTHEPLQEIESADVSEIVDSSSQELLDELNEKRRRIRLWPWVFTSAAILLLVAAGGGWPTWTLPVILAAGAVGAFLAYRRDILRKTVVLFYDFDPEMENTYENLHSWAERMAACSKAWHIEAEGRVHDRKYHAGASNLVRRKPTFIKKTEPPYVKTNIATVAMGVGRQTLHFFPDRVLVYDRGRVGAVGYSSLELQAHQQRFIEDESVPRDATVVDRTWKYVNKKGGPDRRFKDNRELPVCLYDELSLSSATGLNEVVQLSRCDVAEGFADALKHVANTIPPEQTPASESQ